MNTVNWSPARLPGIDTVFEPASETVVVRFEADGVPSCTLAVVQSMHAVYDEVARARADGAAISSLVLSSRIDGIFNMGGDLAMMADMARRRDRAGLLNYGRLTAGLVHRTWAGLDQSITTFAAVDGDAFGGGCEAALSANYTIASRSSRFAFPETRFGLFPGMGATSLVGRRVSPAFSANMIGDGRTLGASEAAELDLIDGVVERGTEAVVLRGLRRLGADGRRRLASFAEMRRRHASYSYAEAVGVVGIWVDAVLSSPERALVHIERIVKAQKSRLARVSA